MSYPFFALLSKKINTPSCRWLCCIFCLVSSSLDEKVCLNDQDTEVVSMIWSSVMGAVEWNKKEDLVLVSSPAFLISFHFSFVSLF
jgi:hypothetical protein